MFRVVICSVMILELIHIVLFHFVTYCIMLCYYTLCLYLYTLCSCCLSHFVICCIIFCCFVITRNYLTYKVALHFYSLKFAMGFLSEEKSTVLDHVIIWDRYLNSEWQWGTVLSSWGEKKSHFRMWMNLCSKHASLVKLWSGLGLMKPDVFHISKRDGIYGLPIVLPWFWSSLQSMEE